MSKGTMPIFSTLVSVLKRTPLAELASSFWISKNSSTRIATNATDPAIADVVIVETVEVVTVDITEQVLPWQY
jgi:hypothetical protein